MRRVLITVLVAALLAALAAGGFWSGMGAAETGRDVDAAPYTQRSSDYGAPKDHDEHVVRAHPRGLP